MSSLENYLREQLKACGWKDELKKHCKGKAEKFLGLRFVEIIKRKGLEKITIEELVNDLIAKGTLLFSSI